MVNFGPILATLVLSLLSCHVLAKQSLFLSTDISQYIWQEHMKQDTFNQIFTLETCHIECLRLDMCDGFYINATIGTCETGIIKSNLLNAKPVNVDNDVMITIWMRNQGWAVEPKPLLIVTSTGTLLVDVSLNSKTCLKQDGIIDLPLKLIYLTTLEERVFACYQAYDEPTDNDIEECKEMSINHTDVKWVHTNLPNKFDGSLIGAPVNASHVWQGWSTDSDHGLCSITDCTRIPGLFGNRVNRFNYVQVQKGIVYRIGGETYYHVDTWVRKLDIYNENGEFMSNMIKNQSLGLSAMTYHEDNGWEIITMLGFPDPEVTELITVDTDEHRLGPDFPEDFISEQNSVTSVDGIVYALVQLDDGSLGLMFYESSMEEWFLHKMNLGLRTNGKAGIVSVPFLHNFCR